MGRILFFVLLGVGLYVAFRIWRVSQRREAGGAMRKPSAAGEEMVRCNYCGLNVPKSEALDAGGRWYCSDSHRRLERGDR